MTSKDKHKEILENLFAERTKKLLPHIENTIISMFQKDLPVHDMGYVESRLKQVIQDMQQNMDFSHEVIDAIRKEFLRVLVEKVKSSPPKQVIFRKKHDLTEARNARCEPLVHEILGYLLDEKMLLEDTEYITESIKDQNRILFDIIFMGYVDTFFSKMELVLNSHLKEASKNLWGGKEKEEVTMRQVDQALKLGKKDLSNKKL